MIILKHHMAATCYHFCVQTELDCSSIINHLKILVNILLVNCQSNSIYNFNVLFNSIDNHHLVAEIAANSNRVEFILMFGTTAWSHNQEQVRQYTTDEQTYCHTDLWFEREILSYRTVTLIQICNVFEIIYIVH